MLKIMSLAVLAAGFAATPVAAQDKPAPEAKEVRQIVIHRVKDGKASETNAIPPEVRAKVVNCEGEKFEADASSGTEKDKKRTRILLCGKKGATRAETATMLESAVARLEANTQLAPDNKAQIVAQLKAKIAELKAD